MADLDRSAVTVLDNYTSLGNNGKKYSFFEVEVELDGQGDTTDKIVAGAFNLKKVVGCSSIVTEDDVVHAASPSFDGSFIVVEDIASLIPLPEPGEGEPEPDPAEPTTVTGKVRFTVWGIPL